MLVEKSGCHDVREKKGIKFVIGSFQYDSSFQFFP